jgi:hypothetical protein
MRVSRVAKAPRRLSHEHMHLVAPCARGAAELLREITQPQGAAIARRVLEIEGLPAILAFEQFHRWAGETRAQFTAAVKTSPEGSGW